MKIKLRKFSLSDLEQVMEIERLSFPEPWPKSYFEKLYQKYSEGFIVAENEKEVVGYIIGEPKNDTGEIISLAIAPNWRQKGIGKSLTNFLINHFEKEEVKEVLARVRTKNEAGISFHKKLGFEVVKTIKKYYSNGDDAYLMRKEI